MKFDPTEWMETDHGKETKFPVGKLWLRASQAVACYITTQGREILAQTGTEIDITLTGEYAATFRVDAPKATRVFLYNPRNEPIEIVGEVYTNVDRLPHESGSYSEIQKALRLLDLRTMEMERQHRREMAALRSTGNREIVDPETGEVTNAPDRQENGEENAARDANE